jgi:hypothetical protein
MAIAKGKDKDGVEYKPHFEHKTRNPNCQYGVGIKAATSVERHLRESQIVKIVPIMAGTGYWGRAEAECAEAIGDENDLKRKRKMAKRLDELATQLKDRSVEEREEVLLKEIEKWKKEAKL